MFRTEPPEPVIHIYNNKNEKPQLSDEECWASSSGTYSSSSSRSTIAWETNSLGEVFFVESPAEVQMSNLSAFDCRYPTGPPQLIRRRSTKRGKLMRILKRKGSTQQSNNKVDDSILPNQRNPVRVKSSAQNIYYSGEKCTVKISVDPEKRHELGRRATLCEAYLGIIPHYSMDRSKVTVAGFIPGKESLKNDGIQVGDWLQSINSKAITSENVDDVLSKILSPMQVELQFQKSINNENSDNFATLNCPNQSVLVRQLVDHEESKILMDSLQKESLGLVYLRVKDIADRENNKDVIYYFPKSKSNKKPSGFLINTKGAFITLCDLLPDVIGSQPLTSTVRTTNGKINLIYNLFEQDLLMMSFPEKCCTKEEAVALSKDLIRCLNFLYEDLRKCFTNLTNHSYLDHFLYVFFSRLLHDKNNKIATEQSRNNKDKVNEISLCDFSFLQPAAHTINLPLDAQIQIDAALSEMEAMDYRDWNDIPMDCQRLYTILGNVLYHKKYVLRSHLPPGDLIQIHSYMRRSGLLNLTNKEEVKSLVIWKKVFPSSRSSLDLQFKWFLLIVGYGHNLLATLLESGGCTKISSKQTGPELFYVEEAQDTLKHIRRIGIATLAERCINANAYPEIVPLEREKPFKGNQSFADNILGLIKPTENLITQMKPSYEVQKNSTEPSPDSVSQGTTTTVSEISDESMPVLGRRAAREKEAFLAKNSDYSDSGSESDPHNGILDIQENLLNKIDGFVPKVITSGSRNFLIYCVHLDLIEGLILSPKVEGLQNASFLFNFNRCVQSIRKLFNDSAKNKQLLDTGRPGVNKSLIAIKEYGVLFDWENYTYWVTGRLYNIPKPKEFYVCFQDDTPQNLVEMAFRLQSMNC